ncbi:hypothetical protein TIFTF001_040909 [Ficus carica]|uniref:Uncharacterized protein n=1 Tax=Ficus carica TaxID=3494 RepID=A0AA88CRM7_FICCA|nr:hypothetical protein TIFTF001_040909 [Ficus carica]
MLDWTDRLQPLHGYVPQYMRTCYRVSYLPAIPDTRLWKDGAADCFSMYGNELSRVVLIRISHDRHLRGQSYVGGQGVTSSDEEDDIEEMPADPPADPIAIDISSDEEGDDEDMEQAGWFEDQEDLADDPEEILFDDGDWETDSDTAA